MVLLLMHRNSLPGIILARDRKDSVSIDAVGAVLHTARSLARHRTEMNHVDPYDRFCLVQQFNSRSL
jgi:hypothetical protein